MGRGRQLLQYGSNAGLAQLVGATGAGFEKAGRQMVDLGGNFIQQDNYDNKILLDEKIRTANEKAANDLKNATKSALIAKNSVVNPTVTQAINDKFGVGSEPANNALGMIDLGTPVAKPNIILKEGDKVVDSSGKQLFDFPKAAATKVIEVTKPAADGGNDIIYYTDGSSERSKFKMKSDWASTDRDNKIPIGFEKSHTFNSGAYNPELYNVATQSGALKRDSKGDYYFNKDLYDKYMKIGNDNIK